jgi:hypothetical protein
MYSYYLIHCVDDKKTDIRGYFLPPIQDKRLLNWYKQKDFTYAIQKITMDILEIFLVFHSERSSLFDEESDHQQIISDPSTIGPFIGSQSPPHKLMAIHLLQCRLRIIRMVNKLFPLKDQMELFILW